jgi:S1 domain RNA-binding protein
MTGIHPESYELAKKILEYVGETEESLKDKKEKEETIEKVLKLDKDKLLKEEQFKEYGKYEIEDTIKELVKPGIDIREELQKPILRNDILEFEDIQVGMELEGTVRNVAAFGAFVDIGIHDDGLVHISEMSEKFVKDPKDIVKVGDIVKVKVIEKDLDRQKIKLSMKI